jgi:hypothetical protein
MGFLLLRPQDLKGLISMREAIDVVEEGYRGITGIPGNQRAKTSCPLTGGRPNKQFPRWCP